MSLYLFFELVLIYQSNKQKIDCEKTIIYLLCYCLLRYIPKNLKHCLAYEMYMYSFHKIQYCIEYTMKTQDPILSGGQNLAYI